MLPVRIELTTSPLPRGCSNPERASLGEVRLSADEAPEALSRCPRLKALGTAGRGGPKALVERATIITIGLGLAVGFKESVLLRLLAEPAAARPGDAYTARTVTPLRNRGGGLFEVAQLQVAC